MATYRCPVCGATHKQQPVKCRLCGQDMTGLIGTPSHVQQSQAVEVGKGKGIGSVFWWALGGVLLLVLLALLFGLIPGGRWVENVRSKIPVIGSGADDGWEKVEDEAGRFTASLPGSNAQGTVPFAPAVGGQLTQWTATIGTETQLGIAYGEMTIPPGETSTVTLARAAEAWVAQTSAKVDERTETSFAGFPALEVKTSGFKYNNDPGYQTALFVLRGSTIYVFTSTSVYPDQPQYLKMVNGITFT